jgi:hypothetical protein
LHNIPFWELCTCFIIFISIYHHLKVEAIFILGHIAILCSVAKKHLIVILKELRSFTILHNFPLWKISLLLIKFHSIYYHFSSEATFILAHNDILMLCSKETYNCHSKPS